MEDNNRLTLEDEAKLDVYLSELTSLHLYRKELSDKYINDKSKFNELHKELLYKLSEVSDIIENKTQQVREYALQLYNNNPQQGKDIYRGIKERDIKVVEYNEVE